jgi:hypothetical protein
MANIALITNNILSDSGTPLTGVIAGSGTTNYLSKFTSSNAIGNSLLYDDGTNVGIGTITPGAKLDVSTNAGRLRITQNTAGNTLNGLEFVAYNGNVLGGLLFNQSTGEIRLNASSSYFPTIYSMGVEVVRIPTSGNVLIGTTTDGGYKLDVNGTTRFQGNSLVSLNQNAETSLVVSNTTSGTGSSAQIKTVSNGGGAQLGKYSPTTTAYKTIAASDGFLYNYGNGNLSILNDFSTGNINFTARGATTAQVIMNGASQPLALVGGGSSNFSMNSGNDVYFYFNSQSANGRFYANPQPTVQYTYDQPQSVGFVGTLAGGSVWYGNMNGSGGAVKYNCSFNGGVHSHIWYYNFNEQMRLQYTGNLLIGTSTDAGYKLDVNGTGIFRNVLTGYVNSGSLVLGAAAANSQAITITGYYTSGGAISTTNSNARSYNLNMGGQSFGYSASYNGNAQAVSTTDSYFRAVGAINITAGTIALHGYNFSPTITSETNATIYAFSSTLSSASNHYDLYFSGGAQSYIAGSLGIGITSPSYKLDVNGTVRTKNDFLNLDNSSNVRFKITDNTATGNVYTFLSRFDNTKDIFHVIFPSGTLTSSNVNWNFGMKGGANTFSISSYNGTSVSERILVYNNGNVGIGTTTDNGNKLQVTGSATVSGNISTSTLGVQNSAEVNTNEGGSNLLVYADITSGPDNLYSGGQVKANIYTTSVSNPTTINTGTTVAMMKWYPTTSQGVMIDYVFYIDGGTYMRSGTFTAVNDNSGNAQYVDNATPDLNGSTSTVTFAAVNNGGTMEFQVTNTSGSPVYMNILTRYIPTLF